MLIAVLCRLPCCDDFHVNNVEIFSAVGLTGREGIWIENKEKTFIEDTVPLVMKHFRQIYFQNENKCIEKRHF